MQEGCQEVRRLVFLPQLHHLPVLCLDSCFWAFSTFQQAHHIGCHVGQWDERAETTPWIINALQNVGRIGDPVL